MKHALPTLKPIALMLAGIAAAYVIAHAMAVNRPQAPAGASMPAAPSVSVQAAVAG